jgi:hypothetical protein
MNCVFIILSLVGQSGGLLRETVDRIPMTYGVDWPKNHDNISWYLIQDRGDSPWMVNRIEGNASLPTWRWRAGLLYGSKHGFKGRWQEMPVGTEFMMPGNPSMGVQPHVWIVVNEGFDNRSTSWESKEMHEIVVERSKPVEFDRVDQSKLYGNIKAKLDQRIAYANSESNQVNPRLPVFAAAGFPNAESFCQARDSEYILLKELLKGSYK